jgi:hypothetical protein
VLCPAPPLGAATSPDHPLLSMNLSLLSWSFHTPHQPGPTYAPHPTHQDPGPPLALPNHVPSVSLGHPLQPTSLPGPHPALLSVNQHTVTELHPGLLSSCGCCIKLTGLSNT